MWLNLGGISNDVSPLFCPHSTALTKSYKDGEGSREEDIRGTAVKSLGLFNLEETEGKFQQSMASSHGGAEGKKLISPF